MKTKDLNSFHSVHWVRINYKLYMLKFTYRPVLPILLSWIGQSILISPRMLLEVLQLMCKCSRNIAHELYISRTARGSSPWTSPELRSWKSFDLPSKNCCAVRYILHFVFFEISKWNHFFSFMWIDSNNHCTVFYSHESFTIYCS